MNISILTFKGLRKIYRKTRRLKKKVLTKVIGIHIDHYEDQLYEKYVELHDQEANDFVRELLLSGKPCMISKFGTVELSALIQYKSVRQQTFRISEYFEFIKSQRPTLWWEENIDALCTNAGFFPNDSSLLERYFDVNKEAIKQIDVLGSYQKGERFFEKELGSAKRVNLDGYYAPFYFDTPWTIALKGKKVLVVHPFDVSIRYQYDRREHIWKDPNILPDFELKTLKAVQSILGMSSEYENWFDALESMKNKISGIDFDIALIGCGAYGMPLAAHVKKMGKQAVHLAGWTQILFGIKGKRWVDIPKVANYMNDFWTFPVESEKPKDFKKIESGCYW